MTRDLRPLVFIACMSCSGIISSPGAEVPTAPPAGPSAPSVPPGTDDPMTFLDTAAFGPSALRRLSQQEYRATVRDLVGVDPAPHLALLPLDAASTHFDNDYAAQVASAALVEGYRAVADRVTAEVLATPAGRARVVGCTPADAACLRSFVTGFGRRALRRPLAQDEVDAFVASSSAAAGKAGDFFAGVSVALRAFLQDLELLHRVEIGAPVAGRPGVFRLSGPEVASRLSYLLWGTTPDETLLAAAVGGALDTSEGVRAAATRLLASPRAADRVARFHALWLGYDRLPHAPELSTAMHAESDALVRRVVFTDRRPWTDLFTSDETFANDLLARHYGLPAPATPRFIGYGSSGRRGILSHGSFLSNGLKFGDTSPVQRGVFVRNRLFCQDIPPPDPEKVKVNVDAPPQTEDPNACKADRYAEHRLDVGCASCHRMMDPIGMGLEAYDGLGRFRTTEPGKPRCTIAGEGEVVGVDQGTFRGPGELGALAVRSGALTGCFVAQLWEFALGRARRPDDEAAHGQLTARFGGAARLRLDELLLGLVSSEAFRHRVRE